MAGGLIAGFSIRALVNFSQGVVDLGGRLTDLSQQTGISAQLLSGLKSTLEQGGSSVDSFARSVFMAQKNLGAIRSDTEEAARAAKDLGLDYKQLITLSPEEFFDKISIALAKVENVQQRNALGAKLLGRSYQEMSAIIPQVAGKLDEFRDKGIKEEDLERLDKFGDAWTDIRNTIQILAAGPLAEIADRFRDIFGLLSTDERLVKQLDAVNESIEAFEGNYRRLNETVRNFPLFGALFDDSKRIEERLKQLRGEQQALIEQIRGSQGTPKGPARPIGITSSSAASDQKKLQDALKRTAESIQQQNERLNAQILELRFGKDAAEDYLLTQQELREASKGLTSAIVQEQDRRRQLTADLREFAREAQIAADAAKRDSQDSAEWLQFADDLGKINLAAQEAADELERLRIAAKFEGFDIVDAEQGQIIDDQKDKSRELNQAIAELNDRQRDALRFSVAVGDASETLSAQLDAQRQRVELLIEKYGLLSPEVQRAAEEFNRLKDINVAADTAEQLIRGAGRGITDSMRSVALGTQTVEEAFKNMGAAAVAALADVIFQLTVIEPLIKSVRESLAGAGGGGGGGSWWSSLITGGLGLLGGAAGGGGGAAAGGWAGGAGAWGDALGGLGIFRQHGGPVSANRPYIVGEKRPELFVPSTAGSIMPNLAMAGGAPSITYNIDARGAQRGVSQEIQRAIDQSRKAAVSESLVAVSSERGRSNNFARRFS